jgi:hypothetical protein
LIQNLLFQMHLNCHYGAVRDNGLHISQPALISGKGAWPVTRQVPGAEMHRLGKDWHGGGRSCTR